jgi:branched-chain amino acid transport system ATP-binding protein
MTALISTHAFSTGYAGRPVVHDLELAVDPGEVVCLLGPNGAGKTTTMLGLAGELPALSGEARINGERTSLFIVARAKG